MYKYQFALRILLQSSTDVLPYKENKSLWILVYGADSTWVSILGCVIMLNTHGSFLQSMHIVASFFSIVLLLQMIITDRSVRKHIFAVHFNCEMEKQMSY